MQNKKPSSAPQKTEKLWCEHFKEYVRVEQGCKHPKGYCPHRSKCLLYLKDKFKDF